MLLKFARRNKASLLIFSLIVTGIISVMFKMMWPFLLVVLIGMMAFV